jgi:cytochrome P450
MGHFQPDALTLSRGEEWADRRRFTEDVLDTPDPIHRNAGNFMKVVSEEISALIDEVDAEAGGTLDYEAFHHAFRRIVRRVILGDAARDDEELSELLADMMSSANGMPGKPSEQLPDFEARIHSYIEAAEPGSLVSLVADAPVTPKTHPDGQVTHWLFALQDTLAANALRALALIASHTHQRSEVELELEALGGALDATDAAGLSYTRACLNEAMRLWPTTPMLSRELLSDVEWDGVTVEAGTQVLIVNTFMHRDPDRLEYADRFAPEAWTDGDAGADWGFNHFSHGPQGCPGYNLAMLIGTAAIVDILRVRRLTLRGPSLNPGRPLPHTYDYFQIKLDLTPAG